MDKGWQIKEMVRMARSDAKEARRYKKTEHMEHMKYYMRGRSDAYMIAARSLKGWRTCARHKANYGTVAA